MSIARCTIQSYEELAPQFILQVNYRADIWEYLTDVSIANGTIRSYGLEKTAIAVKNCRTIGKKDMKLNDKCPVIKVCVG